MYPRCRKFQHIVAYYSITQCYIRKRTKENTLKSHRKDVYLETENMFSAEVLFRTFTYGYKTNVHEEVRYKRYANKVICRKRFLEVHNHFLKFGTVTDHRGKKMSPVKWNLKETVKSRIDSNPRSSIWKKASALNSTYYSVRTTMKSDLHLKPYKYPRCQELTEAHMLLKLMQLFAVRFFLPFLQNSKVNITLSFVVGSRTETLNRKLSSLLTKRCSI